MKLLRRMLLVNWHYIVLEVIEFAPVTFLTGKNAAGKSTILDALQLVILGDTTGHFFNKAANDNSRRTLRGYLRGEIAEDENLRVINLREGQFSSYVVLEFTDSKGKQPFCCGAVFDCSPDGQVESRFFSLTDELPPFHFIRDGVPLDIRGLRSWGQSQRSKFEMYESNKRYQEVLRGKMGTLNEKFFRLFRKAVPFSPIMDIAGFISEFVCDVKLELDIADMRENIRHYRRMEEELKVVESRVTALSGMQTTFGHMKLSETKVKLYDYLLDRAELLIREQHVEALRNQLADCERQAQRVIKQLRIETETLEGVRAERDRWVEERAHSDVWQHKQQLENQKELLEARFTPIQRDGERQDRMLVDHAGRWRAVADALREALNWQNDLPPDANVHTAGENGIGRPEQRLTNLTVLLPQACDALAEALSAWPTPSGWADHRLLERVELQGADPDSMATAVESLQHTAGLLQEALRISRDVMQSWSTETAELERAISELRRGVKRYDPKVLELKSTLSKGLSKSGKPAQVNIFADLLDIRDESWQIAIEGYLHTQRFYLLVPPKDFAQALWIYDEAKRKRPIYDVGLVDLEKVMAERPERLPGSLAEEIEIVNDDPYVRAYVDHLLGRVMKCGHVDRLRDHPTAITRDGMLYQSHVARQLNPKRWETLYIGKRAIALQLEQTIARLDTVRGLVSLYEPRFGRVQEWARQTVPTASDVNTAREFALSTMGLPEIRQQYRRVIDDLGRLDLTRVQEIGAEIKRCDEDLRKIDGRVNTLRDQRGRLNQQREQITQTELPAARNRVIDQHNTVLSRHDPTFSADAGEPRFAQELQRLGSPETIQANFGRQLVTERNRAEEDWTELVRQREAYNLQFGEGFDVQRRDNGAYEDQLNWLRDSQLTEYAAQIQEAKERAQVQFQEDFVNKLRSNIDTVEQQIKELNHALRDVSFGGRERYRFQVAPNPQYERFYRMLMDDLLLEGRSLFSQAFLDRHGDVIEELFRHIVDVDEQDPAVQTELERNLKKFTDYRTYLDFDLIVKDEEGRESRLSRVMAKKSGGETQTPFYISVRASFAQVYRINQPGFNDTLRLLVFDEAYSKMDHQRIRDSIRLVRDLKLQVILSAPTEKIADIVPLVDRTIVVQRIKSETRIAPFDPKQASVR